MSDPLRSFRLPLLALLLAPAVHGQLDLPDRGGRDTTPPGLAERGGGDLAPHLTCTVCYVKNYTTAIDYAAENGLQNAWCGVCRKPRLHYLPRQDRRRGGGGGLDLPAGERQGTTGPGGEVVAAPGEGTPHDPPAGAPQGADPRQGNPALTRAADGVLRQIEAARRIDDPRVVQGVETLLALGEAGSAAGRVALASDRAPMVLTGVRVLLRTGVPDDAEQVVRRLRTRMPAKAASLAVTELVELDPVRATPQLLCELLDHPQSPVRHTAQRVLARDPDPSLVPLLAPLLASDRGDARYRAVDLLAEIESPRRSELLLGVLGDSRARVAWRAVDALANLEGDEIDAELLARVFGERWVLRPGAYALLTLVEREDRSLRPILHERHTEALLRGLDANDPFVSGSCAAALAGIGFRSESATSSPWLDGDVARRLVEVVSGFEFFDDFEALREPAIRRLTQISGVSFGSNGPAWGEWWLANRDGFVASRAVISLQAGDERTLSVAFLDRERGEAFVLVGPDLAPSARADAGELFFLGELEARDLLHLLDAEGLFGLERLPGPRGTMIDRGRTLEVRVAGRGKNFLFGSGAAEGWFDRSVGAIRALRDRLVWQRFPHPERHGSQLALYRVEGVWWSADHSDLERTQRYKGLIFERMRALPAEEREPGVAALEELYLDEAAIETTDFPVLLDLLGEERWFAGRAERLGRLARSAAGLRSDRAPDPETSERLWSLVEVLHDTFSADAMPELVDLLSASGVELASRAAIDNRPILRGVAAYSLAPVAGEEEEALLMQLLRDPVVDVEIAVVEAAGHARLEALRTELIVRARLSDSDVRVAALESIGRLGGVGAREALVAAARDTNVRHRLAAARGLMHLEDPSTAPLLLTLLRTRATPGGEEVLRQGLLALGEGAWEDLYLAMRSPSPELAREAALLLARQGVPGSAPVLIRVLAEEPTDTQAGRELAILTCVDMRGEVDPAEAWFRWWDGVRHDDSQVWLWAAAEAAGVHAPPPEAFAEGGSRDAIGFYVELMRRVEPWLVERARRELEKLLGTELEDPPPAGAERDAWLGALLEVLDSQR